MDGKIPSNCDRSITQSQRQHPQNKSDSNTEFTAKDDYGEYQKAGHNDYLSIRESILLCVESQGYAARDDKRYSNKETLLELKSCYSFNHLATRKLFLLFRSTSSVLITFAGTPTTTLAAGTDRVTTAPAPTTLSSPISTPCKMVTLAPMYAPRRIMTGACSVLITRSLNGLSPASV